MECFILIHLIQKFIYLDRLYNASVEKKPLILTSAHSLTTFTTNLLDFGVAVKSVN